MIRKTTKTILRYFKRPDAVAAMESAFIFPVMLVLLFGVIDVGNAVILNTKIISATQIASDLITRKNIATANDINEARMAAEAAMMPYPVADDFGLDIIGVRFTGHEARAEEQWRDTFNMQQNDTAVGQSDGLGTENEGVVIVTAEYRYVPRFAGFLTGDITLREVSFARGRDSPYVVRY